MQPTPENWTQIVDVIVKMLAALFAMVGGWWALWQYDKNTRINAAETLLKVEEEFRIVFPTYEEIEDKKSYERLIKPVLDAEKAGALDDATLVKLTQLDRCLRFFLLCTVLNRTLGVDRIFGSKRGVLCDAYYYYFGILLPKEENVRPELFEFTRKYYPRLTHWVATHSSELIAVQSGIQ